MCAFTTEEFEELFEYNIPEKDKELLYALECLLLFSSVCFMFV